MYTDITGVILAGGKSRRMGSNKALLKIGNSTVIEHLTKVMQTVFKKVFIITNDPVEYEFLNLQMYPDVYINKGPLAGIHSAMVNSPTKKLFILSCDMPFISSGVIKSITEFKTDYPVTVVRADGFIQQLAGVYNKCLLPAVEKLLMATGESNKCRVLSLLETAGAEIISMENIPECRKETFFNMNSPEDYKRVLRMSEAELEEFLKG